MQQRVKKILTNLAKEYGITEKEAEFAVKCYYERVREVLEEGNYPEEYTFKKILIPGFGRFTPNEIKIKGTYERQRFKGIRDRLSGEPEPGEGDFI